MNHRDQVINACINAIGSASYEMSKTLNIVDSYDLTMEAGCTNKRPEEPIGAAIWDICKVMHDLNAQLSDTVVRGCDIPECDCQETYI